MAKAYRLKAGVLMASVKGKMVKQGHTLYGDYDAHVPKVLEAIDVPDEPAVPVVEPVRGINKIAAILDEANFMDPEPVEEKEDEPEEAAPRFEPPKKKKR